VLIAGAILFHERLGLTKVLLFLAALLGLILATGIKRNMIDPGSLLGVGFTLLGATLYAGVVLVHALPKLKSSTISMLPRPLHLPVGEFFGRIGSRCLFVPR